ncbi:B3 domain-containing protein Os02g0598200-like [Triticum dicoccoides]|uniref:B3 domain-containing protein Os02g0598200-like n=1 Tax=Triticum dicoccoides TaxID=85692 RepID=UPI0018916239|nr:B3 domain-containing protein Os02g0598200-like [Triticum dicoccoides]
MSSGELARQDRPRSRDTEMECEEEEEDETCKMLSDEEEEEQQQEVEMWDKKVQSRKASTGSLEKGRRMEEPIELSDDADDNETIMEMSKKAAKHKEKKRMHNDDGDHKKKKKSMSSHGGDKNTYSADRDKDKRRDMLFSPNRNKDPFHFKEKSGKMPSSHSGERKMHRGDHHNFNKSSRLWRSEYGKYKGMQKKEMNKDKKPWPVHNGGSREGEKKKTALVLSKEGKMPMLHDSSNNGNKWKKTPMMYDKVKKPPTSDKDEKAGSYDRKKTTPGYNAGHKVQSGHGEKKKVKFAFFKVAGKHFEEFLLIPPKVAEAPKMVGFTNQLVCLEDSEGKSSRVRLSVVDGSLAFYQGWSNFVSDHSIKWAEIIVFEYTGCSKFSVRVFSADSWERVSFIVETRGEEKKQKESYAPDDLVPCQNSRDINGHHYVSGEYTRSNRPKTKSDGYTDNAEVSPGNLVAKSVNAVPGTRHTSANSIEDPNGVVGGIVRGSSMAPDNKDGHLANGKHTANASFPSYIKVTTRSPETVVIADEAPLARENKDTVALDNKEANLTIRECKTKCNASITCNDEKATRLELVPVTTDAAPLSQENGDAVELTTFAGHIEDAVMMKESTSAKCAEIHGSDEDLRRKQEGNTVRLECTAVVDKFPSNNKMDTNGDACSKYEYPGGFQCLEKWKEATVSGREALDGSGLIRPEKRRKTEEKSVGAMGVNPVERGYDGTHSCVPSQISESGLTRMKIEHSVNGKGATGKPETKIEQVGTVESIGCRQERNNISTSANRAVACQTEHHFFRQEDTKSSNPAPPVPLLPVKVEVSELDDHRPVLKANLQFVVPSTAQTRLELPDPLSNAVGHKGRLDRNIVMLKDPMKRLWPVFYHETSLFVGFTGGWKSFVAANKLEAGDLCVLLMDLDEDELVYDVEITRK